MRALKVAVVVMGVLIVVGTMGLLVGIVRRSAAPVAPASVWAASVVLDEPAGTRIVAIAAVRDRLAVQWQGGGVDRVVLIDPVSGSMAGRVSLAR